MKASSYDLHRLEILRYDVLPRQHSQSVGYGGLRLVLPQGPGHHELDTILVNVLDWRGQPQAVRVHRDTAPSDEAIIAPGRVCVRSHDEMEGMFYTFGARLMIDPLPRELVATVVSAAPVLELSTERETTANLLAAETEALLGRLEAEQDQDHDVLVARLMAAGPVSLFQAVTRAVLAQYETAGPLPALYAELVVQLKREQAWYQQSGRWSTDPPDLRALATD